MSISSAGAFEHELNLARRLRHQYIVMLYGTMRDDAGYHLCMELCVGGDLHRRVSHPRPGDLQPAGLRSKLGLTYLWQMLSGIAYMHHHRFCHRDIKAENYLLSNRKDNAELKLCDFGHGYMFEEGVQMTERVGTAAYLAPEILRGMYDHKVDIWAIGCVAFFMFTTSLPFDAEKEEELFAKIANDEVDFSLLTKDHTKDTIAVVRDLLTKDAIIRKDSKAMIQYHPCLYAAGQQRSVCCAIS